MTHYICTTCGTQYAAAAAPPGDCPICEDERQYVNPGGQQWTTLARLQRTHRAVLQKKEPDLYGIGTAPEFGIGQRALLVRTPRGNLLWDCISLIDDTLTDIAEALGGLDGIAISHPHYYSSMIEWSRAFGGVPVYLHESDRQWVQRPDDAIQYWQGASKELFGGLRLHRVGGHFAGGAVLHWEAGAGGRGALLTGDIVQVVPDRRHVSFMYSYPNHIPLSAETVSRMAGRLSPLSYDRIYGAWWSRNITVGARESVARSADRYCKAIG